MLDVEIMTTEEVAQALHTTPMKVTAMVLNGTLPVGCAAEGKPGERNRTIIIKKRLEAWLAAKDLGANERR